MSEDRTAAKPAKTARKTPLGIRRRHVLIGAGAAAGGLAITRVLGLHHLGDLPTVALPGQTQSPAPNGVDWISPLDRPEAQGAHLLRRATFGAAPTPAGRRMASGNFHAMPYQVTIAPGMLRYLDLGTSTGRAPNENYSRELMELFTMGVGTFTEDDVRNGAKALAGWREPVTQAMYDAQVKRAQEQGRQVPKNLKVDDVKTGVFEQQRAYVGGVKFLGLTKQWEVRGVLEQILAQDSVAPFIVTKILREFVTDQPSDAYVKRLADGFRKSRYDVKALMRDVFLSPEFIAPTTYRALVKSPTELMVHMARALETPALAKAIGMAGQGMGQTLFDPPEVGGWPSNASWVSSNNVLERVNFAQVTLTGMPKIPPFKDAYVTHLDGVVSPATAQLLNSSPDDATRWLILLASPEFQLK